MTTNYDSLWTRSMGARAVTKSVLEKYGGYLNLTGMNDILHDGCVDGYLTKNIIYPYIQNNVKTIVATDRWQNIIDVANQENSSANISYKLLDIMNATDEQLDQMKNHFDCIFSMCVAEWKVPNSTLFEKYYKILKNNGQLFMVILADTPLHRSYYEMAEDKKWASILTAQKIFENYTEDPVGYTKTLTAKTGFTTDVCEVANTSMPFDNFPDVVNLVSEMYFKFWDNMTSSQQKEFLHENLERTLSHVTYSEETGMYDCPFTGVICIATKS